MAEGGSDHEHTPVDGATRQSLDSYLLECPICLEQLRQPKSLPCLHSFCLDCLGSYITKELSGKMASASSFSCPVCRKVTEPVNQSEGKESWAEQFPTNNLAVKIIQQLRKTDKSITCKPCENKGNMNVPANFWCKHNDTYFCEPCKINIHDLFHECGPEKIEDFNKSVRIQLEMSASRCGKHKEKMEYFCEDHQILGCSKCITVDHRKCEVVTSADDYRDRLRKSSKIDDLLEELGKSADAMEIMIKDFGEQLQAMTIDQDTALQSLTDVRKKIDERFDVLQKELADKLITAFKEEKENLEISRKQCERLMFSIQNTLTSSKDVAVSDDTVGTIGLFKRGQAEVESCKELIKELERSSTSTSIKHEYDIDIFSADTNTTSLTMGKIVVNQQSRKLPSTVYSNTVPLSDRQLKMKRKFTIKVASDKNDCKALGLVVLTGGRVVVGDKMNKKIKLFTENGDFKCALKLTDVPCDLCRIDGNTVAVMLKADKIICIVNVGNTTLIVSSNIQIQNLDESCLGITYHNNFAVGTTTSLNSVSKSGDEHKTILSIESKCLHLASNQTNGHVFASICTSTPGAAAVIRLSDDTHTDILKVGVVKGTTGIDVDREGNVYVCGWNTNNVIQMSGDGTNIRELLTSSDGIKPRAISVWEDSIVITSTSSDQRNFVHMYQLV